MLVIGWESKDPDKPRSHFCSGYLSKAGNGDDNTTGKNHAHEMRGFY